jgi:hypothetical protein
LLSSTVITELNARNGKCKKKKEPLNSLYMYILVPYATAVAQVAAPDSNVSLMSDPLSLVLASTYVEVGSYLKIMPSSVLFLQPSKQHTSTVIS